MNFKEYDEIIKKHKYDMLFIHIYYCLKCSIENLEIKQKLSDEKMTLLIKFIHKAYLKDENYIDIAKLCDEAIKNCDKILLNDSNIFGYYDLLELCF